MKVAFSTTKSNFISRAIIYFTRRYHRLENKPMISHSFPILGYLNGLEMGISADEIMTNIIAVDRYRTPGHVLRVYELPREVDPATMAIFISKVNQKLYGHLDLAWHIWRWVFPNTGRNPIRTGLECMQITASYLRAGGYGGHLEGIDDNSINAVELENIVREIPGVWLVEEYDE